MNMSNLTVLTQPDVIHHFQETPTKFSSAASNIDVDKNEEDGFIMMG